MIESLRLRHFLLKSLGVSGFSQKLGYSLSPVALTLEGAFHRRSGDFTILIRPLQT